MENLNIKGIDISNYQGVFDCNLLKDNGIQVCIIESGDGITFTNPYLEQQYTSAINAGLKIGFYHFFRAEDNTEQQAQAFWNRIKDKKFDIYPILDVEVTMNISNVTDAVLKFANTFKKLSGKDLIIYSYTSFINTYLDNRLSNFNAWIADYGVNKVPATIFKNYVGWQYTDNGRVSGLNNQFDLDKFSSEIFLDTKYIPIIPASIPTVEHVPQFHPAPQLTLWKLCVHGQIVKNLQYELDIQTQANLTVDGWFGQLTLDACINIYEGAQGQITQIMQQRLIANGFNCGNCGADGDFGPDTLQSLENFQASKGLIVDGVCGKHTWKALMLL